jgi:hypothetical protein
MNYRKYKALLSRKTATNLQRTQNDHGPRSCFVELFSYVIFQTIDVN